MNETSKLAKAIRDPGGAIHVLIGLARGHLIKAIYRVTRPGVEIGSDFRAYCWLHIRGPGQVKIGHKVSVGKGFQRRPVIATYAADSRVSIGDGCVIGGARLSCARAISLGDNSLVASVTLTDTDLVPPDDHTLTPDWIESHAAEITIGRDSWLGVNCFVLRGSRLGDDTIVAAGAVVREMEVGSGKLVLGNPARALGRTMG